MKEICLMFSGGLDTTYTAIRLLDEFDRVHLLTFDSGRMICVRLFSRRNARALIDLYGGDRLVHHVIRTKELLDLQLRGILAHMARFRSPGVICASCQLAMDVKTVLYCLEHRVPCATDGKSRSQTEVCLQTLDYCSVIGAFMAGYGIDYRLPPGHEVSRNDKRDFLRSRGMFSGVPLLTLLQKTGLNNFSDFLGRQPLCCLAVGPFILTSPLRHVPPFRNLVLSLEGAREYRSLREPLARDFLARTARERGFDLEERIEEMRALTVTARAR